jgi:predicted transposase YdaD
LREISVGIIHAEPNLGIPAARNILVVRLMSLIRWEKKFRRSATGHFEEREADLRNGTEVQEMQEYDTVLKALLQASAHFALEQISGSQVVRWLPIELPKVQNLRMDLLAETATGELLHFELQSLNDARMPLRMAEYMLHVWRLYGRFPRQIVLYVGEAPLRMVTTIKEPAFSFSYELVDIRELDAERLLESPWVSDNILAILGRLSNPRETVRRVLRRISQLSGEARGVAFQQLSILAGLRRLGQDVREEAKQMPILNDIMDHDIIGPAIRQGMQQGIQQGMQQGRLAGLQEGRLDGLRDVTRHLIEKRFGPLPNRLEAQLLGLTADELDAMALDVIDAGSVEALFRRF